MKSIKSAIFILANLTATAALEEAIGMVRPKTLMTWSTSDCFLQTFSPENAVHVGLVILLAVGVFLQFLLTYRCDIKVY
jgi:hypothetical protein